MASLLQIMFVLLLVLLVVMLVGHGLWVVAAALLQGLRRLVGGEPDGGTGSGVVAGAARPACRQCGETHRFQSGMCFRCGYRVPAGSVDSLQTALDELDHLWQRGRINTAHYEAVRLALVSHQLQLRAADTRPITGPPVPTTGPMVRPRPESAAVPPVEPQAAGSVAPAVPVAPAIEAELVPSAHPLDVEPPVRRSPFAARPALASVLQSFLDEKNIRWGELASGILIVGSAIGLVISLRATLAQLSERVPYFPALLFMLGTAAIHAAGLYTLQRWKLRATSRGVLIIATLLVPLSFAAGIILAGAGPDRVPITSPLYILAVAIGLVGYGTITNLSAQALFPRSWWPLVVAVMVPSAGQIMINRLATVSVDGPSIMGTTLLFSLPAIGFLVAVLAQLQSVMQARRVTPARAMQTFTVLGTATFSLAVPLVLLLWLKGEWRVTLAELSPVLSVLAAAVIGTGLALHQRCTARAMTTFATTGTALAILGAMLLFGTVLTAWPRPDTLAAVGALSAITLIVLGWHGRLPILLGGGIAAGSGAWLVGYHALAGHLPAPAIVTGRELVEALLMGRSGLVLLVPWALAGTAAEVLRRYRKSDAAAACWFSTAGLGVVAALLGVYAGFISHVDGDWTTPLFGILAAASLIAAARIPHVTAAWLGSGLALVGLVHLSGWNQWALERLTAWQHVLQRPVLLALVAHGVAATLGAGALALSMRVWTRRRRGTPDTSGGSLDIARCLIQPLVWSGVATTLAAAPAVVLVQAEAYSVHAWYSSLGAAALLTGGLVLGVPWLISAAQLAATLAVSLTTAAVAQERCWPNSPWKELWHWQLQLAVLGLWCGILTGLRIRARRWSSVGHLLRPPWPQPDQILLGLLTIALLAVTGLGCLPSAVGELGVVTADRVAEFSQWRGETYVSGGWIACGCVTMALVVSLGERLSALRLAGLCGATAAIPLLVAVGFEPTWATASALRWGFAGYALVWSCVLTGRRPLAAALSRLWKFVSADAEPLTATVRATSLILGVLPVIALTGGTILRIGSGQSLAGPASGSWLGVLDPVVLYGGPLLVLVVTLLLHAVRDRLPDVAFAGGVLLEAVVCLTVAFPLLSQRQVWTAAASVQLLQWSGCGLVAYAAIWLALRRWIERPTDGSASLGLRLQLAAATAAVLLLAGWTSYEIARTPSGLNATATALRHWSSLATIGGWMAVLWWAWPARQVAGHVLALGMWALLTLAATLATGSRWLVWPHYHQLTSGWLVLAGLAAIAIHIPTRRFWSCYGSATVRRWGVIYTGGVLALAWRSYGIDPLNPWWTSGVLLALALLMVTFGLQARQSRYAYASLLLAALAATAVWRDVGGPWFETSDAVFFNLLAIAILALVWLAIELAVQIPARRAGMLDAGVQGAHRLVSWFNTIGLFGLVSLTVTLQVLFDSWGRPPANVVATPWAIAALAATVVLLTASLWDGRARWIVGGWYLSGLTAIGMGLHLAQVHGQLSRHGLLAAGAIAGAGYLAVTSHCWKWGLNGARWAARWGVPNALTELRFTALWLPGLNLLGTSLVCLLGLVLAVTAPDRTTRMAVALAPLLAAYGVACLAQGERRGPVQCLALLVAGLAAVFAGWAHLEPSGDALSILRYAVQLVIVLAALTAIYGLVVPRLLNTENPWYAATRSAAVLAAAAALVALAWVLVLELGQFRPGVGVALETPQVVAVTVMLGGLVVALLAMAVLPGRDPLELSESGRGLYVYAAQIVAALMFAHLYLTKPQLFDATLRPYWPYLVVALAFASVALGEVCQRLQWRVLAVPIQRTGGFLPLIPAVGIWLFSSQANDALVLFFAGLVYVMLAVVRRSFLAGALAALAGNGAFWALLHDTGFSLVAQPQLWLIPPAVSALAAAQINRRRLGEAQLTAIRYICIVVIYVSSSGEMFLKLLAPESAGDWSRPVILASLAVLGMFAGIALRVRAFLYLGASFLLLSVVAMVWNAARLFEHTWPWWAFGITLGLSILVMFGLFEKHRQEALQLIQRLRQWEP